MQNHKSARRWQMIKYHIERNDEGMLHVIAESDCSEREMLDAIKRDFGNRSSLTWRRRPVKEREYRFDTRKEVIRTCARFYVSAEFGEQVESEIDSRPEEFLGYATSPQG